MSAVHIFGEVLFDCFPGGERVLGGAPFNVSWHLQRFGDRPCFISAVGEDAMGDDILRTMREAGMDTSRVQRDSEHGTGLVEVTFEDGEPHYHIREDVAWDHIRPQPLPESGSMGILYHGSLGLRHDDSRQTLQGLIRDYPRLSVFLDVNLRPPWWDKALLDDLLAGARWCKLNADEIAALGYPLDEGEEDAMRAFRRRHDLELLILTRGAEGAVVLERSGRFHRCPPTVQQKPVDTVGAGDAFSAVFLHGLLQDWAIPQILEQAQGFAARVVGIRGATPDDPDFYRDFIS